MNKCSWIHFFFFCTQLSRSSPGIWRYTFALFTTYVPVKTHYCMYGAQPIQPSFLWKFAAPDANNFAPFSIPNNTNKRTATATHIYIYVYRETITNIINGTYILEQFIHATERTFAFLSVHQDMLVVHNNLLFNVPPIDRPDIHIVSTAPTHITIIHTCSGR